MSDLVIVLGMMAFIILAVLAYVWRRFLWQMLIPLGVVSIGALLLYYHEAAWGLRPKLQFPKSFLPESALPYTRSIALFVSEWWLVLVVVALALYGFYWLIKRSVPPTLGVRGGGRALLPSSVALVVIVLALAAAVAIVAVAKWDDISREHIAAALFWGTVVGIALFLVLYTINYERAAYAALGLVLLAWAVHWLEPHSPCLSQQCVLHRQVMEAAQQKAAAEARVTAELNRKRAEAPPSDKQCPAECGRSSS